LGEYNGFDVNLGIQLDVRGLRLGAFALGTNHGRDVSAYRSTKLGALVSVSYCVVSGGLCRPSVLSRPSRDTVFMPAPPPDTVVLGAGVDPMLGPRRGRAIHLCLATGQSVEVELTTAGDTLVGPEWVSVKSLRPGMVFAGTYAGERSWFAAQEPMTFEGVEYRMDGPRVELECGSMERVGEFRAVPVFVVRGEARPFQRVYLPMKPGVWQEYRAILRGSPGRMPPFPPAAKSSGLLPGSCWWHP
jgi:hypothetical protein